MWAPQTLYRVGSIDQGASRTGYQNLLHTFFGLYYALLMAGTITKCLRITSVTVIQESLLLRYGETQRVIHVPELKSNRK